MGALEVVARHHPVEPVVQLGHRGIDLGGDVGQVGEVGVGPGAGDGGPAAPAQGPEVGGEGASGVLRLPLRRGRGGLQAGEGVLDVGTGAGADEVGGAGTVLASSLKTWLQTRRTSVKITVESAGRTVTLNLQTVGEVAPLIEQVLQAGDDH